MTHWMGCDFEGCDKVVRQGFGVDVDNWLRVFSPKVDEDGDPDPPMDFCSIDHLAGWALRVIARKDSLK